MAIVTATIRLSLPDMSDAEAQTWAETHTVFDMIDKGAEIDGPEVEPPWHEPLWLKPKEKK